MEPQPAERGEGKRRVPAQQPSSAGASRPKRRAEEGESTGAGAGETEVERPSQGGDKEEEEDRVLQEGQKSEEGGDAGGSVVASSSSTSLQNPGQGAAGRGVGGDRLEAFSSVEAMASSLQGDGQSKEKDDRPASGDSQSEEEDDRPASGDSQSEEEDELIKFLTMSLASPGPARDVLQGDGQSEEEDDRPASGDGQSEEEDDHLTFPEASSASPGPARDVPKGRSPGGEEELIHPAIKVKCSALGNMSGALTGVICNERTLNVITEKNLREITRHLGSGSVPAIQSGSSSVLPAPATNVQLAIEGDVSGTVAGVIFKRSTINIITRSAVEEMMRHLRSGFLPAIQSGSSSDEKCSGDEQELTPPGPAEVRLSLSGELSGYIAAYQHSKTYKYINKADRSSLPQSAVEEMMRHLRSGFLPAIQSGSSSAMPGQSHSAMEPSGLPDTESRFLQDFELCSKLGRGAFGYVFEAKHRTDGRHYAVKIVGLPDDSDKRERVLREVRSLASLNHRGIIRYFNSWWEHHSHGWEKSLLSSLPTSSLGPEQTCVESDSFSTDQEVIYSRVSDMSTSMPPCKEVAKPGLGLDLRLETDGAEFPSEAGSTGSWMSESASPHPDIQGAEEASLGGSSHQQQVHLPPDGDDRQSRDQSMEVESAENRREPRVGVTGSGDQRGTSRSRADPRTYLCIQTELCSKKTLHDLLAQRGQVRDGNVPILFRQIVEAVAYIHSQELIHRDLKPSNIFLVGEDHLKIGDFGLVTRSTVEDLAGEGDPANAAKRTADVGTTLYMSPEQMEGGPYDSRADIYALGIVYLELLVPFGSGAERVKVLEAARRLQFPEALQRDLPGEYQLLRRMLSERADERPTAEETLNFLSSG